jgi:hypothetical protein
MQGDPESGGPMGRVGDWVFIAFLLCLGTEMSLGDRDVSQVQIEVSWEGEVSP